MPVTRVTDRLSVATQPALPDFPQIAAAGFRAVVNNRPDGEQPGQPGSAAEAAAAEAAGMSYAHIPVSMADISEAAVRSFQQSLAAADGPVLAHCLSGTRSLMLYALGEALDGRLAAADMRAFGARFGINLSAAEAWLHRRG